MAHAFCIITSGRKGHYAIYGWEQAGVPAWRRWLYPGGRWCGPEVRRKFAWVVTPYQGGWRRWATMTPMIASFILIAIPLGAVAVSYTHLRAHETPEHLVCRLLLEKKK
eukprot:TRINITY_DN63499_c0_g1_i1.p2 TRINITY_DN63499_c0_g1~~TRINITY_DN63499_c0_g1_i1.p2  ORF type:complete len:109 (-),score=20.66 TRINITY_DN63499_c0_g1_i1:135-461(-)